MQCAKPYTPGEFYKRELPCILSAMKRFSLQIETMIIDGYVWLDASGRKGLGAILYELLGA